MSGKKSDGPMKIVGQEIRIGAAWQTYGPPIVRIVAIEGDGPVTGKTIVRYSQSVNGASRAWDGRCKVSSLRPLCKEARP